jgi:hypothetical protein
VATPASINYGVGRCLGTAGAYVRDLGPVRQRHDAIERAGARHQRLGPVTFSAAKGDPLAGVQARQARRQLGVKKGVVASHREPPHPSSFEREKGFEPSTSTLAKCSLFRRCAKAATLSDPKSCRRRRFLCGLVQACSLGRCEKWCERRRCEPGRTASPSADELRRATGRARRRAREAVSSRYAISGVGRARRIETTSASVPESCKPVAAPGGLDYQPRMQPWEREAGCVSSHHRYCSRRCGDPRPMTGASPDALQ